MTFLSSGDDRAGEGEQHSHPLLYGRQGGRHGWAGLEVPGAQSEVSQSPVSLKLSISLTSGQFDESVTLVRDYIAVMGLTERQFAAVLGAGYALGASADCAGLFCQRNSFHPSGSTPSSVLSNVYFTDLLGNSWQEYTASNGNTMYKVIQTQLNHHYQSEHLHTAGRGKRFTDVQAGHLFQN